MTRRGAMTKTQRTALADALRHMRGAGVKRSERLALVGNKDWMTYRRQKGGEASS